MRAKILATLMICCSWQAAAQQLTADNFLARTTADMVALCAPAPSDPMAAEGIHFCHGYLIGAYHYHLGATGGHEGTSRVCLPNPAPSRDAGVAQFVSWARAHPQYMNDRPAETEFRFLEATWPCRR
jgi:hypothetical protein